MNRNSLCDRCSDGYANVFLEVYDPRTSRAYTYYLCDACAQMAYDMAVKFVGARGR